jgi:hypothetical protein|tara:strand:- start:172 stop:318 length:147 start_codon:yes stop_codon:yes gene_type:complete
MPKILTGGTPQINERNERNYLGEKPFKEEEGLQDTGPTMTKLVLLSNR